MAPGPNKDFGICLLRFALSSASLPSARDWVPWWQGDWSSYWFTQVQFQVQQKKSIPASPAVERSLKVNSDWPNWLAGGNLCPRVESPQTMCPVGRKSWTTVNTVPSKVDAESAKAHSLRSTGLTQCSLTPVPLEPKIMQDEQQYIQTKRRSVAAHECKESLSCHFPRVSSKT